MAMFTTETDVREKFLLTDTALVTTAIVTRNIDDAHVVLLRFLDPQFDVSMPDAALVLGETLLAGAYLLRTLATSEAFLRKRITVGGQRVDVAQRFEALNAQADDAEHQAWETFEPFLLSRPADKLAAATDSQPIVEEG